MIVEGENIADRAAARIADRLATIADGADLAEKGVLRKPIGDSVRVKAVLLSIRNFGTRRVGQLILEQFARPVRIPHCQQFGPTVVEEVADPGPTIAKAERQGLDGGIEN